MFIATASPPPAFDAVVVKISDGDTINAVIPGTTQTFRVRLACIDSPESRQIGGKDAKDNLTAILPIGTVVQVLPMAPNDRYNRILAFVFSGKGNINLKQVVAGQAWFYSEYRRTCPEYAPALRAAEIEAKLNRLGLWGQFNPCAPWDWRSKKCADFPDRQPSKVE